MMLSCGHTVPDLAFVLLVDEAGHLHCPNCQRSAFGACEAAGEPVGAVVFYRATWIQRTERPTIMMMHLNGEA